MPELKPSLKTPLEQEEENIGVYPTDFLEALDGPYVPGTIDPKGPLRTTQEQAGRALMYGLPNTVIGGLATITESMPGLDEQDAEALIKAMTTEGMYQDFREKDKGYRTGGDLVMSAIPILNITKVMRAKSVYKAVEKVVGQKGAQYLLPSQISMQDRIGKLREKAAIMAKKQQNAFIAEAAPELSKAVRKEYFNEALDTLKIGLGTDLGIYAMLNESQFFFPDELSTMETAAFYGVPNVVISGVSGAFMRYKLKNILRDVGAISAEARNPAGLPLSEVFSRPGERSPLITVYSAQKGIKQSEFRHTSDDPVLHKNLNNQIQELDANITQQVQLSAADSPVTGVSTKWEIDLPSMNTVKASLDQDYSSLHNVISIEKYNPYDAYKVPQKIADEKTKAAQSVVDAYNATQKYPVGSKQYNKALKDYENAVKRSEQLDELSAIKLNPDGSMQLAATSKLSYDDILTGRTVSTKQENVKPTLERAKEGDIVKITDEALGTISYSTKFTERNVGKYATTTDNLRLIIPESEVKRINGVNYTEVIDESVAAAVERYSIKTRNAMQDFHFTAGKQGKKIFDNLTPKQQNALLDWGSKSSTSKIRTWAKQESTDFDNIYLAFAPMRQRLREVANKDGTITLFRGEAKSELTKQTHDIVPMTANPQLAKKYAEQNNGQVISKRVPVDDIIAVVGSKNAADEFIVRGNANRNFGSYVSNSSYEALTYKGKTAVQTSMREAIRNFDPNVLKQPIEPNAGMHHIELDGILEIADNYGRDNPVLQQVFKFNPQGLKNFDDVEFASILSKYREWVKQNDFIGGEKSGLIKLKPEQQTTREDLIQTLNLPNDGVSGMHPLMNIFNDAYVQGVKELSDMYPTMDLLKANLAKSTDYRMTGMEKFLNYDNFSLRGQRLKVFPEERKPVILLAKTRHENPLTREEIISQAIQSRMDFLDKMKSAGAAQAPLIQELTEAAVRDVERWNTARRVDALVEGSQLRSDHVTQSMFGVSNQPAHIAVDAIRNEQDNIWRRFASEQFEQYNPTFNRLLSVENKGDLNSFALAVNQQGIGWRGLPELEAVSKNGKLVGYRIPLEDHQFNKQLFKRFFGDAEMPETAYIPEPILREGQGYKPLVISPLAAEATMAFNDLSQTVLKHINYLRELSGRPPIPQKLLHMPPKNLQGKELVYLLDKNTGKLHTIKAGNTPLQAKTLAEEEITAAKKQGHDLFMATETELENYQMLKLEAFEKMTDYSTTFSQTGAAKGTSFGQTIETGPDVVTRMQEALINQYATVSKVSSAMIFEPEFRMAEFAARTAGLQKSTLQKGATVWDSWMNRALGNKSGNRHKAIGKFYGATEDVYDKLLQTVWDQKVAFYKGGMTAAQAKSGFKSLDKAVPEFNPFKDSVEFLENTMRVKTPHNMLKHMSKLNNLTGLAMLRMFEIGLGLVNIGTLPTLIPVVARALQRQKGQPLNEWKALNAAWSSPITDDVAIWNPYRAFASGMHFMFNEAKKIKLPDGTMTNLWKDAAKKGHLWQETVEKMQIFTAPAQGYTEKMVKHYAEMASMFVDKTEQLSRAISYGTFYNLGRRNLKLGHEASMDFAHQMANRVIGDFRPNNRPQIFQGAVGMPFGLFTTFAWNYLQRVFGYLEKGQFKTFMQQMGLQASFFGAKSLPGFNQYVEHFTNNYDGSENMVDRLDAAFGSDATDFLLFGTVGSLTGLASYTRTDIRLPGSNLAYRWNPLDMAPAASLVGKTLQGMGETMKSLQANRGINTNQIAEIASRTFPIKSVRGWIELGMGYSVDSRGQMLDSKIEGAVDVISRLSSVRTKRNQRVIEEFSRQRSQQLRQMDIRRESRNALRAAFRGGELDGDLLENLAKDYIRSGGDPSDFPNFLRDQAVEGLVDKAYLRALEAAKDESRQRDYQRLMRILAEDSQ